MTEDYHNFDEIYVSIYLAECGDVFKFNTKDISIFDKSVNLLFNYGNDNYHAFGSFKFTGNQSINISWNNIRGWSSGNTVTEVYGIKYF